MALHTTFGGGISSGLLLFFCFGGCLVFFSQALTADVTYIYSRRGEQRSSLEARSCETYTDSSKHILPLPAL